MKGQHDLEYVSVTASRQGKEGMRSRSGEEEQYIASWGQSDVEDYNVTLGQVIYLPMPVVRQIQLLAPLLGMQHL